MNRSALRHGLLLAGIGYAAVLAGCFSDQPSAVVDPPTGECRISLDSPVIGTVGAVVAIRDFAFHPAELRVPRGTRVTWVYCEPPGIDPHTTTSDTGVWDSDFMSDNATFDRVFDQVGRFDYHCLPHPNMRATVIVE